jgi:hypothetical protein
MKKIILFCILPVWLFFSCGTTTAITSSWKAPGVTPRTFDKLMVLGLIRNADRSIQQNMENHLVGDLKELGYNAYSALEEYGPKAFENLTEEQSNQKLKASGFDAVLTIVLLDKQQERYYVPGRVIYTPYFTYHTRFWGYYRTIYDRIETPGYYSSYAKYFWESNLYDLTMNKLLYSIQTQSFEPSSREALAHEYGKLIIKNMITNNLLIKRTTTGVKSM